ncbi:hypothetical protein AB5I39_03930 [Sphingomonas sp. MMS24-J45]|uniref:hypothetical protein n=1 Tax=Sphingomonas sp. MMS24-J45 TaxID=3238806 RepID=UPI00384BCB0E
MTTKRGSWTRRSVAFIGALTFVGIITVSTEQARPAATKLGQLIGVVPTDQRLASIADAIAVSRRLPSAKDIAFAYQAAQRQPLSAPPFFIVAATRAPAAVVNARTLNALALRRDPRLAPAWAWQVADRAKANDAAAATRALIRLAVLNRESSAIWQAIAQVSADPVARKEIKAEIARGAAWRDTYLTALSSSNVDRAIVFEMLESSGKHAPVTNIAPPGAPDDRRAFLAQMIRQRDYERAYLAWIQWLPDASQKAVGRVFDGAFTGAAALPPFAWELADGAGGTTSMTAGAGLTVDYSGSDGSILAKQMLLLPPGRYRIVTQAKFDPVSNENGAAPLIWAVTCASGGTALNELPVPLDGTARRVSGTPFAVAAGCEAQTLSLKVNSADFAKHLSGAIRSVAIEAVQ